MEENNKKNEIVKAMMDVEYYPAFIDEVNIKKYTKFPLTDVSALGAAFASLSTSFRTVKQTFEIGAREVMYRPVFRDGITRDLVKTKDGTGFRGAFWNGSKLDGGVKFVPATGNSVEEAAAITFDPVTLFIAIALMSIDKKLDSIQEAQQEIIEFLEQKEKSKLRGNLKFLTDVLNNYKYNWTNEKFKNSNYIKALDIKQESEQSILFYREEIDTKVKKQSFFHSDKNVKEKLKKVQSEFKEYQLALYLYSFSSFLEVMLLQNFESTYLDCVAHKIEDYAFQYRELYTACYNQIEGYAKSSIQSYFLSGLTSINKGAGNVVAKIPMVCKSQIDESLIEVSERLGKFNSKRTEQTLEQLVSKQSSAVRPFVENINTVNKLYNQPMELLFDRENIYVSLSES